MIKKTQLSSLVCASLLASSSPVLAQEVNWSIETGLGYETNVFHAPDHSYTDWAALPAPEIVNPVEKDGLFIPVDVEVEMRNKIDKRSNLLAGIGLDTKIMLDSDLSDATSTDVDFEIGYERLFTKKYKGKKRRKVGEAYIGAFISTHSQVYVDKDTGLPKTYADTTSSLSDKYSYQSVGVKGEYKRKVRKMEYMAGFVVESLNYDSPEAGSEYDHDLLKIDLGAARDFSKSTSLKVKYSHWVRDYSKRYSRTVATGLYSTANDLLEYTYDSIDMTLGQKVGDNLKLYLDLDFTTRTDAFEGYNDYSKTDVAVRARYNYSDATKIRVKVETSSTDYDNAFNFEDNTRGSKKNSGFDLDVKVENEWGKNKLYYVELNHTDRKSTDDRYDYTNDVVMVGAKWEY